MKEKSPRLPGWLSRFMESDNRARLVVALGLIGMALVLASGLWERSPTASAPAGEVTAEQYARVLEQRLEALLTSTEGVGKTTVMVTLENSAEVLYAKEQKRSADSVTTYAEGTPAKAEEKEDFEESYIMVDGSNGRRQALALSQREPTVKGVVVVCPGARDPVARERVTAVVTTALGIRTIQVCVVPAAQ